ncbi:MAG: hypothetical protein OEU50_00725 [Gammaproteobacteria bacterium]|nr:hypothetical protein [Gammaproteobacteria bacterium]
MPNDAELELSFVSPVLAVYVDGLQMTEQNLAQSAARIREPLDRYLVVILRQKSLPAAPQRARSVNPLHQ